MNTITEYKLHANERARSNASGQTCVDELLFECGICLDLDRLRWEGSRLVGRLTVEYTHADTSEQFIATREDVCLTTLQDVAHIASSLQWLTGIEENFYPVVRRFFSDVETDARVRRDEHRGDWPFDWLLRQLKQKHQVLNVGCQTEAHP